MQEQIAEFLSQGMKASDVASVIGVQPSVISELINTDEGFRELLRQKIIANRQQRITTKYDTLEENTLKQLNDAVVTAEVSELTRVLESIAKIKAANKSVMFANVYQNPTQGVVLQFPQQVVQQITLNDNRQIVAIGEQNLAPMAISKVKDVFASMDKIKDLKELENVTKQRELNKAALNSTTIEDLVAQQNA
jgi:plasmid maintenance system antidote protein VapI